MSKEAMKLALEALEDAHHTVEHKQDAIGRIKTITALREALAEQPAQQQEPVAFIVDGDLYYPEEVDWETLQEQGHTVVSLYKSPPAPMSEPNRVIAYAAASKLRELGYEWMNDAWTHLDELAEQPAQQEPFGYFKAEPFGWTDCAETDEGAVALYERPPAQRTWVGLTDEEAFQICVDCGCLSEDWLTLLDAIEAKLKEKNT